MIFLFNTFFISISIDFIKINILLYNQYFFNNNDLLQIIKFFLLFFQMIKTKANF